MLNRELHRHCRRFLSCSGRPRVWSRWWRPPSPVHAAASAATADGSFFFSGETGAYGLGLGAIVTSNSASPSRGSIGSGKGGRGCERREVDGSDLGWPWRAPIWACEGKGAATGFTGLRDFRPVAPRARSRTG